MELDYEKKDLTKSPKVKKVVKPELPEGCSVVEHRGRWISVDVDGNKGRWNTRDEAVAWLTK